MIIIPAVDIKDGACVRLVHGDPSRETVYSSDPVEMAQQWVTQGAKRLHVVDLDAAFSRDTANLDVVYRIKKLVPCEIQMGGGLRDPEYLEEIMALGIDRAIIGTAIFKNPEWVEKAVRKFGHRLMAAVDVRDGEVRLEGWTTGSGMRLSEALTRIQNMGFSEMIFTDISRDGTLQGPSLDATRAVLKATPVAVYASGGISTLEDIRALKSLEPQGLKGCVVGKALYAGQFSLADAIRLS
jgi:phosphoribosylformimino-5-aminoimidazole carboxamide ribotide isomerase